MAPWGQVRRVLLIFLLLGLSFVHSSLIPETCEAWKSSGQYEDVNFDEKFELKESNCGVKVELEKFSDSAAPTVTFPKAVRIY